MRHNDSHTACSVCGCDMLRLGIDRHAGGPAHGMRRREVVIKERTPSKSREHQGGVESGTEPSLSLDHPPRESVKEQSRAHP
jgi:hypothetical protein